MTDNKELLSWLQAYSIIAEWEAAPYAGGHIEFLQYVIMIVFGQRMLLTEPCWTTQSTDDPPIILLTTAS